MGIVPLVGHATISEDVIGRKLVDSANGVIALDNKKGLEAMVNGLSVNSAQSTNSAYDIVVDAVAKFNEDNAAKVVAGKATGGWTATTLIVGPAFYAKLQKSEAFVRGNANFSINEAVVGRVAGLDVVYTTAMPATVDFIVMNPNGFLAPKGVSATEVFDKVEGRPGAILAQSEMVYGFKQLDTNQIHAYTLA